MRRDNRKRYHFDKMGDKQILGTFLSLIEQFDQAGEYEARNKHIYAALSVAVNLGFEAGIRLDPDEPEWPVVFIELPTGQVSWHVPQHQHSWDGHSNEEKSSRVSRYIENIYFRSTR